MQTLCSRQLPHFFPRSHVLGLLAAALLAGALLAPVAAAAQESYSKDKTADHVTAPPGSNRAELSRIMADLEDVISALNQERSLNAEEIDNYRHELALIYSDMDALSRRLDGMALTGGNHGGYNHGGYDTPSSNDWQPYPYLKREIWPDNARFKSWDDSADIRV